jgi:hypothetical protein
MQTISVYPNPYHDMHDLRTDTPAHIIAGLGGNWIRAWIRYIKGTCDRYKVTVQYPNRVYKKWIYTTLLDWCLYIKPRGEK